MEQLELCTWCSGYWFLCDGYTHVLYMIRRNKTQLIYKVQIVSMFFYMAVKHANA